LSDTAGKAITNARPGIHVKKSIRNRNRPFR
jgi:hypothetical protein